MPEVGEFTIPRLLVTPFDGTTAATLQVFDGADVATPWPVTKVGESAAGQEWLGDDPLEFTAGGLWHLRWQVTGTGMGRQTSKVAVAPDPLMARPAWATTTDLADWTGAAPPLDARRMLQHATRKIRSVVMTAFYDVDELGEPTDAKVKATLRDAVCDLVQWYVKAGDEHGARSLYTSVSIGGVSLSRGARPNGSTDVPPVPASTYDVLRVGGLLDDQPVSW
ncbi:hypothetical protein [Dactylosporangium sp. CS-033363]|uniref:hypothetical protein n=1 Tax=Dactylosporangium sp. CS-033363 TaxID=3239935 RepID=UPI003D8D5BEE